MKKKFKMVFKELLKWLDVIFLIPGMMFITFGVFKIYLPAGYISIGICFLAFAFFIAKKYSTLRR